MVASVISMALVGLLDAFRLLLIGPILDQVLNPSSQTRALPLLPVPLFGHRLDLRTFVPAHLHNVWSVVAFAMIISTLLKGMFDYAGTYLANYAGYGMVTDMRNDLNKATLRRSVGFFQQYSTGTLLSAIVNDVERVQFAMSSVLAEFLQQFFSFIFIGAVVISLGRHLTWVLLIFVPFVIASARRVGDRVRKTTRKGQDKLAEINNLLHETITGIRIVKAFCMEAWEMGRFREAARRLFRANLKSAAAFALNSPIMDAFGAIAIVLLILLGRDSIKHGYLQRRLLHRLHHRSLQAL